jgi:large subunit ribosomal protein L6
MFPIIEKISIPKTFSACIDVDVITFSSKDRETFVRIPRPFEVSLDKSSFVVLSSSSSLDDSRKRNLRNVLPMSRTLKARILQAMSGASSGYTQELDVVGVGYKVELKNDGKLLLKLGFSHDVLINIPENIEVACPKETMIILKSSCKESLGSFVAYLKNSKALDVYKNKGVLVKGENLEKKKFKKK